MISSLIKLFFPTNCASCKSPIQSEDRLCIKCINTLPYINLSYSHNHVAELRLQHRFPYDYAYSTFLMSKNNSIKNCLYLLKYKKDKEIGTILGRIMADDLKKNFPIHSVDCIVPIPLSKKKELVRGYNQSTILCDAISKAINIPCFDKAVIRIKNTESQTRKSRIERLKNMENTFQITNSQVLEGKHILLIDDVLTTGATLEACAMAIHAIKNAKVSVATLALASEF